MQREEDMKNNAHTNTVHIVDRPIIHAVRQQNHNNTDISNIFLC